ncbi:MAG TPA: ATP-binding protein [Polyangiaceae bacterium]|nr:ATP-binding protein [Polyangiaceae bacterium]
MTSEQLVAANLRDLEQELAWFARVLELRLRLHFPAEPSSPPPETITDLPPPRLEAESLWAELVRTHRLGFVERLAFALALATQLRPELLDVFFAKNATFERRFTEFGGRELDDAFEPTLETLAFVLDGGTLAGRSLAYRLLDTAHVLQRAGLLASMSAQRFATPLKAPLRVTPECLTSLLTGRLPAPALSAEFPAERLTTRLGWEDLVLHPGTLRQLQEIRTFVEHGNTLLDEWEMASRLRPGFRALFHGPPGTGKSLSAALLGQLTGREVYRVDLSLVVSKYIGETQKNLSSIMDKGKDWILFFDEADALFGRRTETRDAHDRYANQEVAYLLQRIETFEGIVILASNLRENLDAAFTRRFEAVVYFPLPRGEDRLKLWQRGFSHKARLLPDVDLNELAEGYELSGAGIMNVIRQVSLAAIADSRREIGRDELLHGIRRELGKEGRT